MIELGRAHSTRADLVVPEIVLPAVENIYMTSLPVAQALQPSAFNYDGRAAVEGQDFKLLSYDKVQTLVGLAGQKYFNMYFNQKFSVKMGEAKYFRIYQGGNNVQLALHRAPDRSHVIALNESSWSNTWQTMALYYRSDGYFEWYWQGIRKWNGWPGGQPIMPFLRLSSPGIIEIDSGQSGLAPPAGYTWLEPE